MIILDASVINKIFLPIEEGRNKAKQIIERHINKLEQVIVPDLLYYEIANTLVTKTQVPVSTVLKALKRLYSFNFEVFHPLEKDMRKISKFAKKYKISVYDASYAVLAQEKRCNLVTADQKFVKLVNLPNVLYLGDY